VDELGSGFDFRLDSRRPRRAQRRADVNTVTKAQCLLYGVGGWKVGKFLDYFSNRRLLDFLKFPGN